MPRSELHAPSQAGTPRRQASNLQPQPATPLSEYSTPQGEPGLARLRVQQQHQQQPFLAESPTGVDRAGSGPDMDQQLGEQHEAANAAARAQVSEPVCEA